jgi:hypothetical protein
MALTYEQARRQAEVCIDAFNRRDPEPILDMVHDAIGHRGPFVVDHVGHEHGRIEGKEAQREFLRWLWAQEPSLRHVLDEVLIGLDGFAMLTHSEQDGTRYVFVNQVDEDGSVRDMHVYHGPQSGG